MLRPGQNSHLPKWQLRSLETFHKYVFSPNPSPPCKMPHPKPLMETSMNRRLLVAVAASFVLVTGFVLRAEDKPAAPRSAEIKAEAKLAADGDATANTLTDDEKKAGWKLLFDGKTLDGWN